MKKFKKLISVMLTVVMALAMSMTAFAEEQKYTVTINNPVGEYQAYQIFAGDLSGAGTKESPYVLSNIKWGSGVTKAGTDELGDAATKAKTISDSAAANKLAEDLVAGSGETSYLSNPVGTYTMPEGDAKTGSITGLPAGYYLIRNVAGSVDGDENNTYTDFIVQVVGPVTVTPKGEKPEVEKKVKETNDSTGAIIDWQDAADYDIGDRVPFQLTGTLPNNYNAYDKYSYTFTDVLSSGLSYDKDSGLKVYVVNGKVKTDVTEKFNVQYAQEGRTLTVSCSDLKQLKDITVSEESKSTIVVEYTALLNDQAVLKNENKVTLTYSNDPTHKGEGGTTGKTPEDKVVVFTYNLNANKIDGDSKEELKGAGFTLYKIVKDEEVEVGYELKGTDLTTFSWNGLDAGQYVLRETTTPTGYNTCDDIEFTIGATYDTEKDDPQLLTLEVKDKAGITLSTEAQDAKFTATINNGQIGTDIANYKGATLPSTGGIGTTIFYVVGALLMIGAGIMLVSKKRMVRE